MSVRTRLATVDLAESDCALRRAAIAAAWREFKRESERAATPGRVIGAGLAAGFVSGLRGSGSGPSGSGIVSKLFGMLMESAFANIGAELVAGAAAASVEKAAEAEDPRQTAGRG